MPRPHAQIPGQLRALRDHAVRQLEKKPSLSRGAPCGRPGRNSPGAPALARVTGQRHQEAWAAGTEEDGSVTREDGSGWARTVSRDNLEGAGCTGHLASQGAWRWGGSDQEHQLCSCWGVTPAVTYSQAVPEGLATLSVSPGGARPPGGSGVRIWARGMDRENGVRDKSLELG